MDTMRQDCIDSLFIGYDNITLCAMKNVVIMMIGETSTRIDDTAVIVETN